MKYLFRLFFSFLVLILFAFIFVPESIAHTPPDFQKTLLVGTGLEFPTGLEIAPDGRIFIVEQGGKIKIYKNGRLLETAFDELPAFADADRGLLGIAFDPDFNSNHYVYFYYIGIDLFHHVVRFDASEDVGKEGPVEIYNSHAIANSNHAGGTIQFGPDGKLYVSIGDSGNPPNSQSLSNPLGKILRLNKDGTIPSDNPFAGDTSKNEAIFAYGFRNPFRFQFDKQTGLLYVGDVGDSKWEEINIVEKGGNYGWPLAEGHCSNCAFTNPLYSYFHDTPSYSVTGGFVYRGTMFPEEYRNNYFFGDFAKEFIKRASFDQSNTLVNVVDFDDHAGSIVDLKQASDGSFYYVTIYPGQLFRVSYTTGNKIPIVQSNADILSGVEPLTVHFSSAGSSDPEGSVLSYQWDFGDGSQTSEANPTKTYGARGKYVVELTVSDGTHSAKAFPITIQVGIPPTLEIISPADNTAYKAGDSFNYELQGKSANGADLNSSQISTRIVFHHSTHTHPFIRTKVGNTGSFTIPTTGESATDVWYELIGIATDSEGLTTVTSVRLNPVLTTISLATEPHGLQIILNGVPVSSPNTIPSVVGYDNSYDVPMQQLNGIYYEFDHWSNNGPKKQTIAALPNTTTYTAYLKKSIPFKGEYFDNKNLSGSPKLTRNDDFVDFTWNSSSPDPSLPSDNFSVRWTKKQFFSAGRYKFTTVSDDGVRLWINNTLVIDKWIDQGATTYNAILELAEGEYDIKLEYFDSSGGAIAKFNWDTSSETVTHPPVTPNIPPTQSPTSIPTPTPTDRPSSDGYSAQYFNNQKLEGIAALTRIDPEINFSWNRESPATEIPADQFSVRWTKTASFEDGMYEFKVTGDDGVRLYIDGQLVVDKWRDQGSTTYFHDHYLTAGTHTIKMEYYEAFGGAVAKLSYVLIPDLFEAEYFDNQNIQGIAKVRRLEPNINLTIGKGMPVAHIPEDHFSVRWSKKQYFANNNAHSFTIKSDDGVRLWIDGQLLLDDWTDHSMKTYVITKQLDKGIHHIKMEYYENGGSAVAILHQNTP